MTLKARKHPTLNDEQYKALLVLDLALTKATESGLLDEIQSNAIKSPDSINDVCDAVDSYFEE